MTVFHACHICIMYLLHIYHHMPHNSCSLLLAATYIHVGGMHAFQRGALQCNLLFIHCMHAVQFMHVVQFAICCHMPYWLLFVATCCTVGHLSLYAQSSIMLGKLDAVSRYTTGSTNNHNSLSDKVHHPKK